MPTKQHKPLNNKPEAITSQELTPIEKKLLEYAEKGQPVLLYSENLNNAHDLVFKIHLRNGGKRQWEEYVNWRTSERIDAEKYQKKFKEAGGGLEELSKVESQYFYDSSKGIMSIDCGGLSVKKIYDDLSGKKYLTDYDGTICLGNVAILDEKTDCEYCHKIARIIRLKHLDEDVSERISFKWLIITTCNKGTFLSDCMSQFEKLDLSPSLEPKKQDTAKQDKFIPFPTPSGTQWHEVKISFIDNENVSIKIRDVSQRKNYAEMGFKDQRTCKPVKSWNILLDFSEKECLKYSQNSKSKTEKAVEDLRKRLKSYFCIQSDPIVLARGYKPVFEVCKSEGESRSVHGFSNSDAFDDNPEDD